MHNKRLETDRPKSYALWVPSALCAPAAAQPSRSAASVVPLRPAEKHRPVR